MEENCKDQGLVRYLKKQNTWQSKETRHINKEWLGGANNVEYADKHEMYRQRLSP